MNFNNGQVNLWRGTSTPTTPYHIWLDTSDNTLKIFNGDDDRCKKEWEDKTKWVTISSSGELTGEVAEAVETLQKVTINGVSLLDNPEILGTDIKVEAGNNESVASAIKSLNASLETLIYD
jgi:hypothetical protein